MVITDSDDDHRDFRDEAFHHEGRYHDGYNDIVKDEVLRISPEVEGHGVINYISDIRHRGPLVENGISFTPSPSPHVFRNYNS